MSYVDSNRMSGTRIASIVIVALLHAILGYAFVTGLAYNVVKKVASDLNTFDVEEEAPPPEEEPPPPPPDQKLPPPPVVTPPPIVQVAPQIQAPVIIQRPVISPPPIAPPPPPPPPKPQVAERAQLRSGSISNDDYPPSAQRNEESGTTVASFVVGTDGRVTSCNASGASPSLDAETCKLIMRRFRYKPAKDATGNPIAETKTQRVVWKLQK